MTTLQDHSTRLQPTPATWCRPSDWPSGERAVADLFASGIEEKILPVAPSPPSSLSKTREASSFAPPICSPSVRWSSILSAAAGAPIASTELETWRDLYGTLREREALMVAIGPQTERQSDFMAGQHGLPFPVLSDPGNAVAENSASSTPSPSTTATTTSPSSSTSPSSMASRVGACPSPRHTSSTATAASSSPKPTQTSASAPSPKKRLPPHSLLTAGNSQSSNKRLSS